MSGRGNPYKIGLAPHEPTPPVVETLLAQSVSQVSAQLHGNATPSGEPITDCHFEYGTSTSYTNSTPCTAGPRKALGAFADAVSALLSGLTEGTVHHYRLVATNSLGTSNSADATFTTLGPVGAPEYGH